MLVHNYTSCQQDIMMMTRRACCIKTICITHILICWDLKILCIYWPQIFPCMINNYLFTYVYQTLKHPLVNPLTVVYYDPIKALPDTSQKKPRVETSSEHKQEWSMLIFLMIQKYQKVTNIPCKKLSNSS